MPRPEKRRFPLHVHISAMFTLLLLLTGAILGLFNYRQTSQIILSSSEKLFSRIDQDVRTDLMGTYQPIRHLLSLLALNDAAQMGTLEERLALLEPFSQALRDNPNLAALYTGYSNGDFFMVRPLRTPALKATFQAPADAAYQVWSIEHGADASVHSQSLFFDGQLNLLSHTDVQQETYDPRTRSWFSRANQDSDQITTDPYVFFSSHAVGTTLARRLNNRVVIAADLTLDDLSATLGKHKVTPNTQIALFDHAGNAVAYPDSSRLITQSGTAHLVKVTQLHPALAELINQGSGNDNRLTVDNHEWVVSRSTIAEGGPEGLQLALLVPEDELLADAYRLRWQGGLITLTILLLCLPLGWLTSRLLVKPLRALVLEADAIRSFNFKKPAPRRSPVLEVDQLTESMERMKRTLASFFEITASLSAETRFKPLLQRVLHETVSLSQAQAGIIYLYDHDSRRMEPSGLIIDGHRQKVRAYGLHGHDLNDSHSPGWLLQLAERDSLVAPIGFDHAGELKQIMLKLDCPRLDLVGVRLRNRRGETIGLLVLLHHDTGQASDLEKFSPDRIAFIQAVSGVAAASIEGQRQQVRQQQLLDAFIQIIAGAIDAKSPYTGGHCQRVPVLTHLIATAAAASDAPALRDYQPTDEDWEALHIAAWLHDCGKVTTPEYVVDKATKLETLYDRIHEIRTRFEVLKRDAWIAYWQGLAQGQPALGLAQSRDAELQALDDDFAFVARSNLGGEFMDESSLARLRQIAQRTWLRTLDDRLGVSWEENKRQERGPAVTLPVREPLLVDRPEHLFERPATERIAADNPWGFNMKVPEHKFNRGELYNLSIGRGTLTNEERYIINHHMVQTILMLSRLPFPSHLQNVAEIAGGHHEKMDGSGYPKGLTREQMSLPARMMAIADIFEALTAADRPYKKGKTLSEALGIMAFMCKDAHIDPDLFRLFVESGIYREYAQQYLAPAQIDEVDAQQVLKKAGLEGEAKSCEL
ncbi:MAG: HD domain-containing protein [Pseudomonas sp.]|uniref:HD domain-containing phosphohydrolase n=1 Tax=Pseudomonas abieticivorans TaxID=2931382 RepID=UPI0020BE1451|nr:HD domain-containing phosphohydrolase [Pseudomonas sp. PIA16]MDE1167675.1 HD domain-containing protein [Pseudomonas sp.]